MLFKDNGRNEGIRTKTHERAVKDTGFGSNHSSSEALRKKLFDEKLKQIEARVGVDREWVSIKKLT